MASLLTKCPKLTSPLGGLGVTKVSGFLLNISAYLFSFFLVQVSGNGNSYYDNIFTPAAQLVNASKGLSSVSECQSNYKVLFLIQVLAVCRTISLCIIDMRTASLSSTTMS